MNMVHHQSIRSNNWKNVHLTQFICGANICDRTKKVGVSSLVFETVRDF